MTECEHLGKNNYRYVEQVVEAAACPWCRASELEMAIQNWYQATDPQSVRIAWERLNELVPIQRSQSDAHQMHGA